MVLGEHGGGGGGSAQSSGVIGRFKGFTSELYNIETCSTLLTSTVSGLNVTADRLQHDL